MKILARNLLPCSFVIFYHVFKTFRKSRITCWKSIIKTQRCENIWMWENTDQKKLRIWILFTQWFILSLRYSRIHPHRKRIINKSKVKMITFHAMRFISLHFCSICQAHIKLCIIIHQWFGFTSTNFEMSTRSSLKILVKCFLFSRFPIKQLYKKIDMTLN